LGVPVAVNANTISFNFCYDKTYVQSWKTLPFYSRKTIFPFKKPSQPTIPSHLSAPLLCSFIYL